MRDCHPEPELSIVVAGTGFVEVASGITEVAVGSASCWTARRRTYTQPDRGQSTDHFQRVLDAVEDLTAAEQVPVTESADV